MRAWFWIWIWMRLLIESRLESESDWACRLRIEPTANLAGRGNCKSWADVKVKVKVAITRSTAPAPISKHARRTAHVLILTLVAKYMAHPHHPTNAAIAWLVLLCRSFILWYFSAKLGVRWSFSMCFFGSSSLGFLDWSCFRLCFVIFYFDLSHFTTGLFRFLVIRGRGNQVINQHASVEWGTRIQECQHTKRHYRNKQRSNRIWYFYRIIFLPCPPPS